MPVGAGTSPNLATAKLIVAKQQILPNSKVSLIIDIFLVG
jgi:hypothetical protein